MTVAALVGAKSFGESKSFSEELKEILNELFAADFWDNKKKKYVVLFLEGDFGSHTRSKKMIMSELQRSIRIKMKWLNCRVSVVDSSTYNSRIFQNISG